MSHSTIRARTKFALHRKERVQLYCDFSNEVTAGTEINTPAVKVFTGQEWEGGDDVTDHFVDGAPEIATAETVPEDGELPGFFVWLEPSDEAEELPSGHYHIKASAAASSLEKRVLMGYDDRPPSFRLVG